MTSKKKLFRLSLLVGMVMFFIPLVAIASSNISGLAVAKYKIEGAQNVPWTNLPINNTTNKNTFDFSLTTPGMSVVTLFAEDKAGNQNYQIKTFNITDGTSDAPIAKIEYRLTGVSNQGWTTYTSPFFVREEGITHMDVRVTDEAGNVKNFKQDILLDKTRPVNVEAEISLN